MGLVDGDGRAASIAGGDDLESLLRNGGNSPRSSLNGHWSRSVQNHEGTFGDLAKLLQPIWFFFGL